MVFYQSTELIVGETGLIIAIAIFIIWQVNRKKNKDYSYKPGQNFKYDSRDKLKTSSRKGNTYESSDLETETPGQSTGGPITNEPPPDGPTPPEDTGDEILEKLNFLVNEYGIFIEKYKSSTIILKKKIEELLLIGSNYFKPDKVNFNWDNYLKLANKLKEVEDKASNIIKMETKRFSKNIEEKFTNLVSKYLRLVSERIKIKEDLDKFIQDKLG